MCSIIINSNCDSLFAIFFLLPLSKVRIKISNLVQGTHQKSFLQWKYTSIFQMKVVTNYYQWCMFDRAFLLMFEHCFNIRQYKVTYSWERLTHDQLGKDWKCWNICLFWNGALSMINDESTVSFKEGNYLPSRINRVNSP